MLYDILTEDGQIHDTYRIDYLKVISSEARSFTDGVDVIGYCTWSFTDLLSRGSTDIKNVMVLFMLIVKKLKIGSLE